jgi:uncharacterized protein
MNDVLAKEFSVPPGSIEAALGLLERGFAPEVIGRFHRAETGALSETMVRRIAQRHGELVELDRRRRNVLAALEASPLALPQWIERARSTTDRLELEDLLLPLRRAEVEVEWALERGLGNLAERITANTKRASGEEGAGEGSAGEDAAATDQGTAAPAEHLPSVADTVEMGAAPSLATVHEGLAGMEALSVTGEEHHEEHHGAEHEAHVEGEGDAGAGEGSAAAASAASGEAQGDAAGQDQAAGSKPAERHDEKIVLTPELARACADFVLTDKDIHTEVQALEGAMRVLADRLGRNPGLRSQLRNLLRKQGKVSVSPGSNAERQGRYKNFFRQSLPLRTLSGPRLISLRAGQRDRAVSLSFELDPHLAIGKVRERLGRHTPPAFDGVLGEVASRAYFRRLLPTIGEELRTELKHRAEEEAERFLVGALRQALLAPCLGPKPAAGVDVDPKGNWVLGMVDEQGRMLGEEVKLEASSMDPFALAEALGNALRSQNVQWIAFANEKAVRPAVLAARRAIQSLGAGAVVTVINAAGLTAYANGEVGRTELPNLSVQGRAAISTARRLQDPLAELVKVEPRLLLSGLEQSLVGKAELRRLLEETLRSSVAMVGCWFENTSARLLAHLPGLDPVLAERLIAARDAGQITDRASLQQSGILDDVRYHNAVAFIRFHRSPEPLDRSAIHPALYPLARRILEATGQPFHSVYGRFGATKGLRRADFDIDEYTWRDLQREFSHPGRDLRSRLHAPTLLASDAKPEEMDKELVHEGIVTSVANYGAFLDLGLEREALLHVSEVGERYLRDAREHLAVGQILRVKLSEVKGPRLLVTAKGVPDRERPPRDERGFQRRGPRPQEGGEGGGEGGDNRGPDNRGGDFRGGAAPRGGDGQRGGFRGPRDNRGPRGPRGGEGAPQAWPEPKRLERVAHARRDGMPGGDDDGGKRPRRGGPGGGGGSGRGPGGFGGGGGFGGRPRPGGDRRGPGEEEDLRAYRQADKPKEAPANNPFASFFKTKGDGKN